MVITMVVSIARHDRPSPTRPLARNVCSAHRLQWVRDSMRKSRGWRNETGQDARGDRAADGRRTDSCGCRPAAQRFGFSLLRPRCARKWPPRVGGRL